MIFDIQKINKLSILNYYLHYVIIGSVQNQLKVKSFTSIYRCDKKIDRQNIGIIHTEKQRWKSICSIRCANAEQRQEEAKLFKNE